MTKEFIMQLLPHRNFTHGIYIKDGDRVMKSVVFEKLENEAMYVEPAFVLNDDECQSLFNALWKAGFRPKDGSGGGGHIEALKYHLEDMRKLVFKDKKNG